MVFVGVQGDSVVVLGFVPKMTPDEALDLAAKLVAMCEPLTRGGAKEAFDKKYEDVIGS